MTEELIIGGARLIHGDCIEVMRALPEASVDSVVTDPPYGLEFMGREWDHGVPGVPFWTEALRVLKPGGHLVAFGGARTYHRLACAIEDAGFEIRDQIMWIYASGFPKSLDVGKAIDKAAGAEREVVGVKPGHEDFAGRKTTGHLNNGGEHEGWSRPWAARDDAGRYHFATAPATDAARQWSGWGTALKPAHEPIVLARKPLAEGTVAAQVLATGTGALNVDATRVNGRERTSYGLATANRTHGSVYGAPSATADFDATKGRWPANLCHDGSDEVMEAFARFGASTRPNGRPNCAGKEYRDKDRTAYGAFAGAAFTGGYLDTGTAARFFFCGKASKADRMGTTHPTTKPIALISWLAKLITPPGGTILDPFAGSGTLAVAAERLGFHAILIEKEAEYVKMIRQRLAVMRDEAGLFAALREDKPGELPDAS